jgi:hypothetical protein
VNLKIACPEFGPNGLRCRLVKLEHPAEDGATHIVLWEPAGPLMTKPRRGSPRRGFTDPATWSEAYPTSYRAAHRLGGARLAARTARASHSA